MKKRGNDGFTLVEVLLYTSIVVILFSIVSISLQKQKEKQEFAIQKRNISQFVRKIQQYSQHNKKEYILDFQISKKTVFFRDNTKDIIDKMVISDQISYMTNNTKKNDDFVRSTTNEGNFERGFSTNTINAAKFPIISIYKAKEPINVKDDYSKSVLWEKEL